MATLLFAAKWIRNAVCGRRAPLPAAVLLQPIGLAPALLNRLADQVAGRLAEVSSLLERVRTGRPERLRFPAQSWEI